MNICCLLLLGGAVGWTGDSAPAGEFHYGFASSVYEFPLCEEMPAWLPDPDSVFALPSSATDDTERRGLLWFRLPPPVPVRRHIKPEPQPFCARPATFDAPFPIDPESYMRRWAGETTLNELPTCPIDPLLTVLIGDPTPQMRQDAWQAAALLGATSAIHVLRHLTSESRGRGFRRAADITDDLLQPDNESAPFKQVRPPLFFTLGVNY